MLSSPNNPPPASAVLSIQRLIESASSSASRRAAEVAYAGLSIAGVAALVSHDLVHPALMYCLQLFLAL